MSRHEAERLASEIDLAAMDREDIRASFAALSYQEPTAGERVLAENRVMAARTKHRDLLAKLVALVPEDEG